MINVSLSARRIRGMKRDRQIAMEVRKARCPRGGSQATFDKDYPPLAPSAGCFFLIIPRFLGEVFLWRCLLGGPGV